MSRRSRTPASASEITMAVTAGGLEADGEARDDVRGRAGPRARAISWTGRQLPAV